MGPYADQLVSQSNSVPDAGSIQTLYQSENPEGPWEAISISHDWPTALWGSLDDYYGYLYRATETGNAINFVGESPPSNIIDLR
jgi:hypothetical protein